MLRNPSNQQCKPNCNLLETNYNLAEADDYVACEGEVSMRCYTNGVHTWDDHANYFHVLGAYIDCNGEEAPKCKFPIAQHMAAVTGTFGRQLKEEHGLFRGMHKHIKQ